jgi:hypothetical protein
MAKAKTRASAPDLKRKKALDQLIAHMAKTLIGSNACWAPG